MTPKNRFATSLTLTGGGSYAAYEVGVMSALFAGRSPATGYTPFDPDLIVGTSGGAVNAAGLIAHEVRTGSLVAAAEALRVIWTENVAVGPNVCGNGVYRIRGLPTYLFDRGCLRQGLTPFLAEVAEDASLWLRGLVDAAVTFADAANPPRAIAQFIDISALVSTAPLLETLRTFLPLEEFARSTRRLRVVALDLSGGHVKLFTEDDVRRLGYLPLQASGAIPIFFPPHQIEGDVYINGTTFATTPLLAAYAESDLMHIIYMDPELKTINPIRLENVIDSMDRVLVVNFAYMLNLDIQKARDINTALALIEEGVTADSLSQQDMKALLRSIPRIRDGIRAGDPYRPLTIHLHHPRDDLGSDLGLMNLDGKQVDRLIERGFADAIAHDCRASGCVFPGRSAAPPTPAAAGPVAPVDSRPFPR